MDINLLSNNKKIVTKTKNKSPHTALIFSNIIHKDKKTLKKLRADTKENHLDIKEFHLNRKGSRIFAKNSLNFIENYWNFNDECDFMKKIVCLILIVLRIHMLKTLKNICICNINSFVMEVPIIQKPVHWFALQSDELVAIW